MNTYADDLKQHRERANLTVRELAAAIDRSTTFITDFELRKKSNPPEPAMMERIAQVLRWPISDQLQAWGYLLDAAEQRANPFARDDPRYAFVETLPAIMVIDPVGARRYLQAIGASVIVRFDGVLIDWPASYAALLGS